MQTRAKAPKAKKHTINFRSLAYEADIEKDRDYLLHLPNGETVCLAYSEDHGAMLSVIMWPGNNKTYIDVRNQRQFANVEDLR